MREKQGPGLFVKGQLVCDVATQIQLATKGPAAKNEDR